MMKEIVIGAGGGGGGWCSLHLHSLFDGVWLLVYCTYDGNNFITHIHTEKCMKVY